MKLADWLVKHGHLRKNADRAAEIYESRGEWSLIDGTPLRDLVEEWEETQGRKPMKLFDCLIKHGLTAGHAKGVVEEYERTNGMPGYAGPIRGWIEEWEETQRTPKPKPPLGVVTRRTMDERRFKELTKETIYYFDTSKTVPPEWYDELVEVIGRLSKGRLVKQ